MTESGIKGVYLTKSFFGHRIQIEETPKDYILMPHSISRTHALEVALVE